MPSSVYKIPITVVSSFPVTANTNLLTTDITFKADEFVPGDSGLVRVWFCVVTPLDADTIISISHKAAFADPEQFNGDQNFVIKSKGLNRFDIPVTFGDILNIQSSVQIDAIRLLRFDKIVIGA